jgi:hypothetical protein
MFGADDGCRVWLRHGISSGHVLLRQQLSSPAVMDTPVRPAKMSYPVRFEEAKRAELQAAYDAIMSDDGLAPAPARLKAEAPLSAPGRVRSLQSAAGAFAAMLRGKTKESMLLKRIRDLRSASEAHQLDEGVFDDGMSDDNMSDDSDSERQHRPRAAPVLTDSSGSDDDTSGMDSQSTDHGSENSY